jgi:PAS domain S-box-containing protein
MSSSPPEGRKGSEHPADLVFIVRRDGEIRFANRPHGGLSEDEVVGMSIFDWIAPDHRDLLRASLEEVFTTGSPRARDLATGAAEGEAWYEWRIKPNRREGAVVSATLVAHDITRHKRALQDIERKGTELERLLEERDADLVRAKAALTQQEATDDTNQRVWRRFRTIMDEAGEAIFITDPETQQVVDLNETACRWIRKGREEVVGRTTTELDLEFPILPPEEAELQFTETRDSRRPLVLNTCYHRRTDGSTFPVEVAVARHRMGDQEYILAVVRDVKGRQYTEEMLREIEAQYRNLFQHSWDPIYITARDGKVVDANPAALRFFGYHREEFVGLDARELFSDPEHIRDFQRMMGDRGAVMNLEVDLATKSGSKVPCLFSAARRPAPNGAIRGYQCLVRRRDLPDQLVRPGPVVPGKETVLVVDEDPVQLAQTTSILESAGLSVLTAGSLERAVVLFDEHHASLQATVLAAEAGDERSQQAVEALRHLDPRAPVVLLSSGDPLPLAESFAHLGIAAFLRKPVHPLALVQKVRQARGPDPAT